MSLPKKPSKYDRSLIEGPIGPAVWRLAWPTMLQNVIAGLQGMIDQAMVGNFVGYAGNAAMGVSWQIFLVLIVFVSSLFSGMGVLVSRFVGANEPDKVNRTVYQALLTAVALATFLATTGYFAAPFLLDVVNAAPEVRQEALPFLRTMLVGQYGMLMFFMLSGAFRAAGDPKTPLRLGIGMTVMTVVFNVILIPIFGTIGAAYGTVTSSTLTSLYGLWRLTRQDSVIHFERGMDRRLDFSIIRALFRFGLPTGMQGVAMNAAGVLLLRFIGSLEHSAQAQAAYSVAYVQLFSLITWSSTGLMAATGTIAGQNLGAGRPDRAAEGVRVASRMGFTVAAGVGTLFLLVPQYLLGAFGMTDPDVLRIGTLLLRFLSLSGLFITVALSYTGGLQGTGDTRSPLVISLVSQIVVPLGLCSVLQSIRPLSPVDIWTAILLVHFTRCALSVWRFRQEKWRHIEVNLGPAGTRSSSTR